MGKIVKELWETDIWLRVVTVVGICLIVAGFILPPLAHIDGSVLTGCGELAGLGVIWLVYYGMKRGVDVTARHNNTEITLNSPDSEKETHWNRHNVL